ncbi:hypothetical protein L0Y69_03255 [bacterium]|nr:hypothetical protein [bacterium]
MSFQFNHKTSVISLLFAIAFGFLFSGYTSSVQASHYAKYPYQVSVSRGDGVESCNSASECDALCEISTNPLACFYFYGDSGLAPQKADYFNRIADQARKAAEILKAKGGPGGCRTTEECVKFGQSLHNNPDAFLREWRFFTIEGIHVENGTAVGVAYLKDISRIAKSLEKAAREKIKPPSICSYGLACFDECYVGNFDLTSECRDYMKKIGYADNRTIALAQLIEKKATESRGGGPGGCWDLNECEAYCDAEEHWTECAEFADEANLSVEVPDDKKAVFAAMEKGESPGQCKDEASCRNYCEDIDHIEECVDFVEKFNLASSDELKEIRQMADVKKAGVAFPGNCKTKESCLKYCDNSANAVVCMEFALKAGFIPKEDAEAVGKIIPYLKSGGKLPGGCTRKESCDAYCAVESHINECADFAVGAGFATQEEAEEMKRTGGKGPGNCRSREACDNYCKDAAHIDECMEFAIKAGFMTREEADFAKKHNITSGPGGCKSKADCEAFCVVNQDVCIEWGKEHGIDMSGGPGGQAGPGGCKTKEECTAYCKDHQEECQNFFPPTEGGAEYIGPGGCKSQAECQAFCAIPENQDACSSFVPPGGGGSNASPPPYIGPGGCKSQAECQAFCAVKANQEACASFVPPGGTGGSGGALPPNITGPGGCKSRTECDAFCAIPENAETCINFAKEQGFEIEGGINDAAEQCGKQGGTWFNSQCDFRTGAECGQYGIWDSVSRQCTFSGPGGACTQQGGVWDGKICIFPNQQPSGQMGGYTGPGGCKTPDECQAYCQGHQQECMNFVPPR